MRKLIVFIFLTLLIPINSPAQTPGSDTVWNLLLKDVNIRYMYSITYNTYLPKPKFGKDLKELDGKEISIKGFFLPVDVTGSVFVISYNPMESCFFCTGSGIETIIEVNPKEEQIKRFKNLETDNYIQIKGKLRLNAKDYEHLVYVLDNVELEKIIK
ncbi:hypothetical protein [Carboxylicivirga sp. RSCT41]|uniref:hypothetical protein n=1 Tax=Carboxylicivirga agarovorans TaxID=3417570 RepID=UPI003D325E25